MNQSSVRGFTGGIIRTLRPALHGAEANIGMNKEETKTNRRFLAEMINHVCQSGSSWGKKKLLYVFQREFESENGAHRGWKC